MYLEFQGLLVEQLCLLVFALSGESVGDVVETFGGLGVGLAAQAATNLERLLVERLRLRELPQIVEIRREVVVDRCRQRISIRQNPQADLQRRLVKPMCLRKNPLGR